MRTWLVVVLLASALSSGAQGITGRVVNALTDGGVPYVLVTDAERKTGVRTDGEGRFVFPDPADSLVLSAPGFRPKVVEVPDADSLVVYLAESTLVVQELAARHESPPRLTMGGARRKTNQGTFGSCRPGSQTEMALFVPNPDGQTGILKTAYFFLPRMGNQKVPFRVRVYGNSDGRPGRDLLDESVLVRPQWWRRWKSVKLGLYNIPLPDNGFFVAMEWLNTPASRYTDRMKMSDKSTRTSECHGPVLGLTDEFGECRWWSRSNAGTWHRWPCEVGQTGQVFNPMIRVEWLRYR